MIESSRACLERHKADVEWQRTRSKEAITPTH